MQPMQWQTIFRNRGPNFGENEKVTSELGNF